MEVVKQLLGRLHPIIVHLPIGFIIFGLLLQYYDRKKKAYHNVIQLSFLWGGLSALAACITGYLQYISEGYSFDSVKYHLWLGIATATFSLIMYARSLKISQLDVLKKVPPVILALTLFLLLSFTGHLGGDITHGEGYLSEPLPNAVKKALGIPIFEEKKIELTDDTWETALFYNDVIDPILNNKCVSCHNPKKDKGELQLHTADAIMNGGESGTIIEPNDRENSELFARLILPMEDEDHMPPEEKTQLSKEEIHLIGTWIENDNSFDKSIGELGLDKELFLSFFPPKPDESHPDIEIAAASQDSIRTIKKNDIHVVVISESTNFLSVSMINKPSFTDADFKLLSPIFKQIAHIDLGGTQVSDTIFERLVSLPNLTQLKLDHTAITGEHLTALSKLGHLKSINLASTPFKRQYLNDFASFISLKKVIMFNTMLDEKGSETLNNDQITIEYGDYEVPAIASDSIVY